MQTNDANVTLKPHHFVGYGVIEPTDETNAEGIGNVLCQIFDNAPRGFSSVYLRVDNKWIGPRLVMGELVQLTL